MFEIEHMVIFIFLLEAHEVGDQSRNGAKKVMNAVAEARQWSATTTTNTTTTTTTITTTTVAILLRDPKV